MTNDYGQKRHWMATIHLNWDVESQINISDLETVIGNSIDNIPNLKYCAWQLELTPTTNKIHIQLYLELKKSVRLSKVIKLLTFEGFQHPHCEPRKSSQQACRDYCLKEESRLWDSNPHEHGEWNPKSIKKPKSMLDDIGDILEQGHDSMWIAFNRPKLYLRYGDRIDKCISLRKAYQRKLNAKLKESEPLYLQEEE